MAFDAQALWDLTGPIAMPSMSDNDFLMLLEKQMQAAHPTSGNTAAATADGQQSFSNNLMVAPSSVMAPPTALADTMTPSLTDESSPSPPASNNDNTVGDGPKRKASRDDSGSPERQPRSKVHKASEDSVNSQPTDDSTRKPPARRKSGGNAGLGEEGRLAKRKEQNRAAQRAFRDRKEKHVRDLEDKIQELEQKYNTSESENTNLKDLLKRLQSENMMLKQSAFTFEFAPTDKSSSLTATSPTANTASSLSSASTNPFTSPSHSHSSASPESTTANYVPKIPNNSLFTANNTPSPNLNAHSDSRENVTINAAGMLTFSNPSTTQPTPATPALPLSSPGAGPSSAFSHASLFTSYRDSSYSLGLPFGDFNTFGSAPNTSGLAADFGMDFDIDMTSAAAHEFGAFGMGSDFDDLFGGQLGALDGTSSYGGVGSATSPASIGVVTSAPTPQSTSASTAPTPASTQPQLIIDGLPSVGESARVECSIKAPSASDWRRCPKTRQEFVDLVRSDTSKPSTFGPALTSDDKARIEEDWQQFKDQPEVKELNVDHLCHELFDKAQCTELKTRMKQSMMRIAKDLADGHPSA
ncbi:unnamed protein product [Rhizoctonia solani]|uniref:BZIP domain-containing protein n=1 Tax=Rhizoctonia solani TaxID=456999 RepID=A0A8H3BTN3_9AGAM|nr:unnamed protein product [Rhizoctonia solani]